jgi:hypothetical protein
LKHIQIRFSFNEFVHSAFGFLYEMSLRPGEVRAPESACIACGHYNWLLWRLQVFAGMDKNLRDLRVFVGMSKNLRGACWVLAGLPLR